MLQVPRWELFMGDRPHCMGPDEQGLRPPIQQIALAESSALPGDVILSREVAEVRALSLYTSPSLCLSLGPPTRPAGMTRSHFWLHM